jgi:hypothetical protein
MPWMTEQVQNNKKTTFWCNHRRIISWVGLLMVPGDTKPTTLVHLMRTQTLSPAHARACCSRHCQRMPTLHGVAIWFCLYTRTPPQQQNPQLPHIPVSMISTAAAGCTRHSCCLSQRVFCRCAHNALQHAQALRHVHKQGPSFPCSSQGVFADVHIACRSCCLCTAGRGLPRPILPAWP